MDHALLLERAELAGRWAVANQVADCGSANLGRYLVDFHVVTGSMSHACNWLMGTELMALLALHEATGKAEYLASCHAAAGYIKTLQRMDGRVPRNFGYIVENTPQTVNGHPRDALTAAWALLLLHRADPNDELLDRAMLFARWFVEYGMDEYPFWTVFMDPAKPPFRQRGSFHGGSPAFFIDLFEETREAKWLDTAKEIADFHIATFLKDDGSLRITVEADTNADLTGGKDLAWEHMHKYNDDFTALAQMKLGQLTGESKYTEAGRRFCGHLLRDQQAGGGFGNPAVPSGSPVAALSLVRAAQVDPANAQMYMAAVDRAVGHILSLQETESDDVRIRGAFYGQAYRPDDDWRASFGPREMIHLRTTSYCTSVLAMLGGECERTYYNVAAK